jgi:hypothetical protein
MSQMITQTILLRLSILSIPSETHSSHKDRDHSTHRQRNLSIIAFRMNSRNNIYLNNFLKKLTSFHQIGSLVAANKITKINLCRLKYLNTSTIKIILKADSQPFPHIRLSWITMPILTKIMSQINKFIQIWIIFSICNQAHQINLKK